MSGPMHREMRPSAAAPGAGPAAAGGAHDQDPGLVAAVASGDRAALGALYDRHAPLLLAFALRLCGGDRASAEGLLHDLFLEVWHEARTFEPGRTSVRAWLTARLRALGLRRNAAAPPPPSSSMDRARAAVRGAITGLPAELSLVLELTYFEGLPVAAVAARTGLPADLIKARLARALLLLRQESSKLAEGSS